MKFLREVLDKQKPLFAKGGKYEKFHYLFEAGETFMSLTLVISQGRLKKLVFLLTKPITITLSMMDILQ
jgi:Na+-transporting NADH:ubiquinone oxidoreductase subunit B